jgi:hypothetical protein
MADEEMKKRTFRCTDKGWEIILSKAERAGISVNQFLIDSALIQSNLKGIEENIWLMRKAIRFLTSVEEDKLKREDREDDFQRLLAEANNIQRN